MVRGGGAEHVIVERVGGYPDRRARPLDGLAHPGVLCRIGDPEVKLRVGQPEALGLQTVIDLVVRLLEAPQLFIGPSSGRQSRRLGLDGSAELEYLDHPREHLPDVVPIRCSSMPRSRTG